MIAKSNSPVATLLNSKGSSNQDTLRSICVKSGFDSIHSSVVEKHSLLEFKAALPVIVCFLLPLVQVGGVLYLYDICIAYSLIVLGFPKVKNVYINKFDSAWRLLIIAVGIGCVSALIRSGFQLITLKYTAQYFFSLLYIRSLLLNVLAGRTDLKKVANYISIAGAILGVLAISQYLLFQTNPSLAENLYRSYLKLSGWNTRFFELRYLTSIHASGNLRIIGTWDVATTFGGMLVLSATWMFYTSWSSRSKNIAIVVMSLAILMTNSRHAWIINAFIIWGLSKTVITNRAVAIVISTLLIIGSITLISTMRGEESYARKDLINQISDRLDRTRKHGIRDSSLHLRYIAGTRRFIDYAFRDPSILLFGFGIHTEKALELKYGRESFIEMSWANNSFGFVSNGWLLIWRSWGVLGLIGLIFMHSWPRKYGPSNISIPLLVSVLIILSDNYSVHVTRCFFLIIALLSAAWAQTLMKYNKQDQLH